MSQRITLGQFCSETAPLSSLEAVVWQKKSTNDKTKRSPAFLKKLILIVTKASYKLVFSAHSRNLPCFSFSTLQPSRQPSHRPNHRRFLFHCHSHCLPSSCRRHRHRHIHRLPYPYHSYCRNHHCLVGSAQWWRRRIWLRRRKQKYN